MERKNPEAAAKSIAARSRVGPSEAFCSASVRSSAPRMMPIMPSPSTMCGGLTMRTSRP